MFLTFPGAAERLFRLSLPASRIVVAGEPLGGKPSAAGVHPGYSSVTREHGKSAAPD